MLELCEEVDTEGRVVGGDELEAVGALGGARLSTLSNWPEGRKRRMNSESGLMEEIADEDEEEGMEVN
ncbi:hypothetical protein KCU71_g20023, partial [Aureobasidium melanogenum]